MSVYQEVARLIEQSRNIVFFGGAGVSTECGIPDFRSSDGLYHKRSLYPPEVILSRTFFEQKPDIFFDDLRENLLKWEVPPNKGHKALAELERMGKLSAVITQNIDDLHQAAGSQNILELHGSLARFYCTKCRKPFDPAIAKQQGIPLCECGGIARPDITLYEESLDDSVMERAAHHLREADLLIVAGTSLVVYPATGLLRCFRGEKIVFINKEPTPLDDIADVLIRQPFARTMMRIMVELGKWPIKSAIVDDGVPFIPHPTFSQVELRPVLLPEADLGVKSQVARLRPGGEIAPHTHDVVEVFMILEGRPQVLIDGDWMPVEKGTAIVAHPGETHGVRNPTDEEALIFATFKN